MSDRPEIALESELGLLEGLDDVARRSVERRVRELRLAEGTTIFAAGEPGDALYMIRSGLVDIVAHAPAGEVRLVTLGPDEAFGEMAVITGRPRSASAVAQTGVTLWRIDIPDFIALLAEAPQVAANVARIVSERLQAATRARVGLPRGQTVVVWSDSPKAVGRVARTLASECARMLGEEPLTFATGPAPTWDGTKLPEATDIVDPPELAAVAVRAVRERSLVLLLCAPEVPTELVGADRMVVLGDQAQLTDTGPETRIRVLPKRADAAILARVAREICGRRVGLALGSGGIRGFAHAGVLKVIRDEKIPVDYLAGASVGSIAGALLLSGWDPEDLADLVRGVKETIGTGLPGFSLNPASILSGRRMGTFFRKRIGEDTTFADLDTPFVVSTTDLDSRDAYHIDAGNVADAVSASTAIPGIFPAMAIGGRRLVDGGMSDPLPVRALRERGADIVIAVDVMPIGKGPLGVYTPRFKIPLPGMVEALLVGLDTIATQLSTVSGRFADVLVQPGAADARWYQVVPARTYQRAGEEAMEKALPSVRRLLGS